MELTELYRRLETDQTCLQDGLDMVNKAGLDPDQKVRAVERIIADFKFDTDSVLAKIRTMALN